MIDPSIVSLVQACGLVVIAVAAVAAAAAISRASRAIERWAPPPPPPLEDAKTPESTDPTEFRPIQLNRVRRRRRVSLVR